MAQQGACEAQVVHGVDQEVESMLEGLWQGWVQNMRWRTWWVSPTGLQSKRMVRGVLVRLMPAASSLTCLLKVRNLPHVPGAYLSSHCIECAILYIYILLSDPGTSVLLGQTPMFVESRIIPLPAALQTQDIGKPPWGLALPQPILTGTQLTSSSSSSCLSLWWRGGGGQQKATHNTCWRPFRENNDVPPKMKHDMRHIQCSWKLQQTSAGLNPPTS